jgi:putative endonuclease
VSPEAPSGEQGDLHYLWYVYFLELKNGVVYVGSTDNLRRGLASHQGGPVVPTRGSLPAALVAYVAVADAANARRLESYFKSGSGKAFAKKRFLPRIEQSNANDATEVAASLLLAVQWRESE